MRPRDRLEDNPTSEIPSPEANAPSACPGDPVAASAGTSAGTGTGTPRQHFPSAQDDEDDSEDDGCDPVRDQDRLLAAYAEVVDDQPRPVAMPFEEDLDRAGVA